MLVASTVPESAGSAGTPAPGSVDTIAGPTMCEGSGVVDETSRSVGALAVDADGRVFFDAGRPADGLIARVDVGGQVSRLLTGLPAPPALAGGPGAARPTPTASRLASDGKGGVLIAAGTGVIAIDALGGVSTVVGEAAGVPRRTITPSASVPGAGDGGPAQEARLVDARSLATDDSGNLFVADEIDPRSATVQIRFVNRGNQPVTFYGGTPQELTVEPGHIDSIAGTTGPPATGDGGPARLAVFAGPAPAMAASGRRLYVAGAARSSSAGPGAGALRLVNLGGERLRANGIVVGPAEVAGLSPGPGSVVGGARGLLPVAGGVAADRDGGVLIADEERNRVLEVDDTGAVSVVAGAIGRVARAGFNGSERPAAGALLNRPSDVKIGPAGEIYVSDRGNGQVRMVDRAGIIHTVPGAGVALAWRCAGSPAGPPAPAQPADPTAVAATGTATYFVGRRGHEVAQVGLDGSVSVVVDAPGRRWTAVAPATSGGLYLLDAASRTVGFLNTGSAAKTVHGVRVRRGHLVTVAGNGRSGSTGDGGPARAAALGRFDATDAEALSEQARLGFFVFAEPQFGATVSQVATMGSLAAGPKGDLFVADVANHRVRRVDRSGRITTFAGEGAVGNLAGCCRDPVGLAVDRLGNLYVGDRGVGGFEDAYKTHPRIWLVNTTPELVAALGQTVAPGNAAVVAGNGAYGFGGDGGRAVDAELFIPMGLTVHPDGSLYVADGGDVRKVDRSGIMSTAVGNGRGGFNGDGLAGGLTSAGFVSGAVVDRCGDVVFSDLASGRVRRLAITSSCGRGGGSRAHTGGHRPPGLALAGAVVVVAALSLAARWAASRRSRSGRPGTR